MRARLVLTALALTAIGAVALQFTTGRGGAAVGAAATPVAVGVDGNEPIVKVAPDGTLYISALEYLYLSRDSGADYTPTKSTDSLLNPNDGPLILQPRTGRVYQPFVDNAQNATATDEELSGPIRLHVWDPASSSATPAAELDTPLVAGAAL